MEDHSLVRFYGRGTKVHEDGCIPLFTSGSGFELRTDAVTVEMTYEAEYVAFEPWFAVWVDGVLIARQPAERGKHTVSLYRNVFGTGEVRTIRVTKETQAFHEDPRSSFVVSAIELAGKTASLFKLPEPSCRLEVIGDSITSGEGTYGRKKAMEWIPGCFSYERTYGKLLGDLMDADISTLSVSGWGVVSSWENNPDGTLPGIYERVCGTALGPVNEKYGSQGAYDFRRQNDAVIINLGTNDANGFEMPEFTTKDGRRFKNHLDQDGFPEEKDAERFIRGAVDFLKLIHEHEPEAFLLWVYGQISYRLMPQIAEAVRRFKQESGYRRAAFLSLPKMTEETEGSREHPGPGSHRECAAIIANALKEYLN